ncbi:MAG: AEC family transporter [Glycocaulis sp.]
MILQILAVFFPAFALVAFGYLARRWQIIPDGQWRGINLTNYRILLPAILFVVLARADLTGPGALAVTGLSALAIFAALALALLAGRALRASARETAALVAVCCVWNVVLFLTLADRLYGEDAEVWTGMIAAPGLVLATITIITAFAITREGSASRALPALLRDPVLMACLAGVAVSFVAPLIPPVLPEIVVEALIAPLELAGFGSLALVLLTVGAGLDFAALKGRVKLLVSAALIRSALIPLLVLAGALALGAEGQATTLLVLATGGPSAAFVYAVASEFNGESGLVAGMITLSVLVSAVVLPVLTALTLML